MRIVYHVPILTKLSSALTEAEDYGKKIEMFVLTDEEYNEFVNENHHCKTKKNDKFYFYDARVISENEYYKNLEKEAIS